MAKTLTTCGNCGRSWDDSIITDRTPAPAGRCPFEDEHHEHIPDLDSEIELVLDTKGETYSLNMSCSVGKCTANAIVFIGQGDWE